MKLPSDVEFHEDIRLLVYRPRGLLNEAAVNKIITVIGELEITLKDSPIPLEPMQLISTLNILLAFLSIGAVSMATARRSNQRFLLRMLRLFITARCTRY